MENIATNKRNLMNPDELLKLDNNKQQPKKVKYSFKDF